jgi:hypothetical protein
MTTTTTRSGAPGTLADFDRTTSIWGPVTMGLGFVITLSSALFVAFGTGVGVTPQEFWTAVAAVVVVFGAVAIFEPLMYYPILGKSAMYQAFMIGNIGNKLLPASIVAQNKLKAEPGSRRAEFISGSAIIGAVTVHLTTLVVFVGVLGTWLLSIIPAQAIQTIQAFILPAVFGAMIPQLVSFLVKPRRKAVVDVAEESADASLGD